MVISIMSLISSIMISNTVIARRNARDAVRLAGVSALVTALQSYYFDHNQWPYQAPGSGPGQQDENDGINEYPDCSAVDCPPSGVNGIKICQANGPTGYYCASDRPCWYIGTGPTGLRKANYTYWIPLLDRQGDYFGVGASPSDPSPKVNYQNCPTSVVGLGTPTFIYRSDVDASGQTYFDFYYHLETKRPGVHGVQIGTCNNPSAGCDYQIRGLTDGTLVQ